MSRLSQNLSDFVEEVLDLFYRSEEAPRANRDSPDPGFHRVPLDCFSPVEPIGTGPMADNLPSVFADATPHDVKKWPKNRTKNPWRA